MNKFWVIFLVALSLECAQRDPWAACHRSGSAGFRQRAPACRVDDCVRCVATLERAWEGRRDSRLASQFRVNFMRASADAREVFIQRKRPEGEYVLEHCTAGLSPGAECAGYTPGCVSSLSGALASGETDVASRRLVTLAAQQACPAERREILSRLTRCDSTGSECSTGGCRRCVAGHIAALTVSAPSAVDLSHEGEFHDLLEATPEGVARGVIEALGEGNAPDDIEPLVAQRSRRGYCISLVRRSATAPPYVCNEIMRRYLTQGGLSDEDAALEALSDAHPTVRGSLVAAAILAGAREPSASPTLLSRLRTLPPEGTLGAVLDAMRSPAMSDGQYPVMRRVLLERGMTEASVPPAVRSSVPTAPEVPGVPESGSRGGGAPRPRMNPQGGAV